MNLTSVLSASARPRGRCSFEPIGAVGGDQLLHRGGWLRVAGLRKVRRATARALVQQLSLRNFAYQLCRGRVEAFVLLFLGQMLIRILSAAGCKLLAFQQPF